MTEHLKKKKKKKSYNKRWLHIWGLRYISNLDVEIVTNSYGVKFKRYIFIYLFIYLFICVRESYMYFQC